MTNRRAKAYRVIPYLSSPHRRAFTRHIDPNQTTIHFAPLSYRAAPRHNDSPPHSASLHLKTHRLFGPYHNRTSRQAYTSLAVPSPADDPTPTCSAQPISTTHAAPSHTMPLPSDTPPQAISQRPHTAPSRHAYTSPPVSAPTAPTDHTVTTLANTTSLPTPNPITSHRAIPNDYTSLAYSRLSLDCPYLVRPGHASPSDRPSLDFSKHYVPTSHAKSFLSISTHIDKLRQTMSGLTNSFRLPFS